MPDQISRLRTENARLKAENARLARELESRTPPAPPAPPADDDQAGEETPVEGRHLGYRLGDENEVRSKPNGGTRIS
jgi:hypothetical protein